MIVDEEGRSYRGEKEDLQGYYCYGKDILAPAEGMVVAIKNHFPDCRIMGDGQPDPDTPDIDSKTLQSKTIYDSAESAYVYKPRGFYEGEYPEHPYPEVVAFTENKDGTITLTVHAVFPYEGISKVYAHEVVIRPLKTGGVQYVSNRIIPSGNNYEETWHSPRLTEKEWEEIYEG